MAETFLDNVKLKIGSESQFDSKIDELDDNTFVGITDLLNEGDFSADVNNKLELASNALPKPTNDTTGSTGQVLKKTASGSEWADGSGVYQHYCMLSESGLRLAFINSVAQPYTSIAEVKSAAQGAKQWKYQQNYIIANETWSSDNTKISFYGVLIDVDGAAITTLDNASYDLSFDSDTVAEL